MGTLTSWAPRACNGTDLPLCGSGMQKFMTLVGNDQCSLLRLVPTCASRATIFRRVQYAPFLLPVLMM